MTLAEPIAVEPRRSPLTQVERDVLVQVARGLGNEEIAEVLLYSTSAIKRCLHHVCAKLGARNRAQAVLVALKEGAVSPQDIFSLEELADLLASLGPDAMERMGRLVRKGPDHP
jgi:DNA-binding CsgD family transcriptional regulator